MAPRILAAASEALQKAEELAAKADLALARPEQSTLNATTAKEVHRAFKWKWVSMELNYRGI